MAVKPPFIISEASNNDCALCLSSTLHKIKTTSLIVPDGLESLAPTHRWGVLSDMIEQDELAGGQMHARGRGHDTPPATAYVT